MSPDEEGKEYSEAVDSEPFGEWAKSPRKSGGVEGFESFKPNNTTTCTTKVLIDGTWEPVFWVPKNSNEQMAARFSLKDGDVVQLTEDQLREILANKRTHDNE